MSGSKGFLDERIARRFHDRIADSLAREPLEMQPGVHRERLKALIGTLGELNFYDLLDVQPGATEEEIHRAYSELARLVHPVHAKPLGMLGSKGALELLFERVTEAYLTLNDPDRSRHYQLVSGMHLAGVALPTPEQRRKEQVEQADRLYRVARGLVAEARYHDAVQTLGQVVKLDPKAEYYALLGECLAHNPNWLKDASRALHSAIELSPHDPHVRTQLALVLERAGSVPRAEEQYTAALTLDPEFAEAQAGLARIRGQSDEPEEKKSGWQRFIELLKGLVTRDS